VTLSRAAVEWALNTSHLVPCSVSPSPYSASYPARLARRADEDVALPYFKEAQRSQRVGEPAKRGKDLRYTALGGWCFSPVLLRPAIKSPLRGCRSPLILNVSTDTLAVARPPTTHGPAAPSTHSPHPSRRVSGFASDHTYVTFLRASRRREKSTSHLGMATSLQTSQELRVESQEFPLPPFR
jgi:hypothetical protein